MANDNGKHWWYCLTHHEVEGDDGCPGKDRLGPYATREEAAAPWNWSRSATASGTHAAATTSTDRGRSRNAATAGPFCAWGGGHPQSGLRTAVAEYREVTARKVRRDQ